MPAPWQISADTGGTFTDCFGVPPGGAAGTDARLVKVLSSGRLRVSVTEWIDERAARLDIPAGWSVPDGFFVGFDAAIDDAVVKVEAWDAADHVLKLADATPPASAIDLFTGEEAPILGARLLTGTGPGNAFPPVEFRLGTTRGTNALLERRAAPVAWFVTRGFGDLLTIRDQRRPDLFALEHHRPAPLAEFVCEVDERLADGGAVLNPLDPGFETEARHALAAGLRVAAVSLLHSYRNPAHEIALRSRLLALGFEHVSLSSDLAPFIKLLPRAETAVVDACLTPILRQFVENIRRSAGLEEKGPLIMTSAGGLEPAACFRPKDSLLSGPAGGVAGAATAARALGFERLITFDMGGTSTDVARFDGDFQYRFEHRVGDATLLAPALKIETVAAGGGSICRWTEAGLRVGPESAGADPGPACYGRGGPLTVTDVNLLLGRVDPSNFGIPISSENIAAARSRAAALESLASGGRAVDPPSEEFLTGLLDISTEQMADAIRAISIRDGADPADYALLAFGGAGPLHACDIAERLGMTTVLVPREAGLLSAYGLHHAAVERFAERQILRPLDDFATLPEALAALDTAARTRLADDLDTPPESLEIRRRIAELRLAGQEATLSVDLSADSPGDRAALAAAFRARYESVFGYPPAPDRALDLVSLRVIAATAPRKPDSVNRVRSATQPCWVGERFVDRAALSAGEALAGPAVIQDPFSTFHLKAGWTVTVQANGALVAEFSGQPDSEATPPDGTGAGSAIGRELFRHRFENIAAEMGAMLQRSAISTNVKERADFSCALLDGRGELVVNAPHIPVHLGALGLCVREIAARLPMRPGDTVITNHPGFGGSHLPDVTLITPVFIHGEAEKPVAYVANRAHHAEIGGKSPGSMPADARCLAEEGVVIEPTWLIERGTPRFDRIEALLTAPPWPTRNLPDNLADLHAQLAANRRGVDLLQSLLAGHGAEAVRRQLESLATQAQSALAGHLRATGFSGADGEEKLDDGAAIRCAIARRGDGLRLDFSGTATAHPGNLNATPAIVRGAVLYTLRLWTRSPLPLNEGLLRDVEIVLPRCFLNPEFPADPAACPAVVGGNVETSQRVVDLLIRLLGFQAGSQGTMNNFIFGNDRFGYYETIGGGAGAGPGYAGAGGLHTHMTNTAIT
ncbi:MAG: hydantoinase B/oxoprolinase family protein, partial [Verrucomicrobiae bacterium]|nr:hydantoinase B/oxoprolinase family protein [Verrucomicrobiae bacterium]